MSETEVELKQIVRSCLEGNRDARTRFQSLFGEVIYSYPLKRFHLPKDKTGDFYVYVFEKDRIFKRLRGFEGRNNAHFVGYLGHYVLRDLFLEWLGSRKEPETVSLEKSVVENDEREAEPTLQDVIADPEDSIGNLIESLDKKSVFKDVLASLDAEKTLILKILHIGEFDLSPQEIRSLCRKSGHTYREVVTIVEEMRSVLAGKDVKMTSMQDQLESVFGSLLLYQKELAKIEEGLKSSIEGSAKHAELCRRKEELQRKLEWRYRQQQQGVEKAGRFRITTPYKDIARLLNVPLGTVCSLVGRIREEILKTVRSLDVSGKATTS